MKILVACEESQRVTMEFRKRGHEAYSCDLLETSGKHPEWHIQGDALSLVNLDWDMVLAFPPCTYLTVTGNRWFNVDRYGDKAMKRLEEREKAVSFFMAFVKCNCEKVAIENPIGVMSSRYRKPDQIIQPYMFGDAERKSTCLWLRGLPLLEPTKIVEPDIYIRLRTARELTRNGILKVSNYLQKNVLFTVLRRFQALRVQWPNNGGNHA